MKVVWPKPQVAVSKHAAARGVGGILPQEFSLIRHSEIASEAILGAKCLLFSYGKYNLVVTHPHCEV